MSRFVKVSTVKYETHVVELKDDDLNDEAYEVVYDYDEAQLEVLELSDVESAIRHADEVHYLEDEE